MAQYHQAAQFLKLEVEQHNFSSEQLTTILKMMRGCVMLRKGSYIQSFFECMIPQGYELKEGKERLSKYGKKYRLSYVVKIGEDVPAEADTPNEEEN